METAGRDATTSPTRMSAVLSMSPVYRVGRIGLPMVPDGWGGCDGCGATLPGITQPPADSGPTAGRRCREEGAPGRHHRVWPPRVAAARAAAPGRRAGYLFRSGRGPYPPGHGIG